MSERTIIFKGGLVAGARAVTRADVLVADGVIAEVAPDLAAPHGAAVLDASGCVVGPGLVDLHTHVREPGDEEAETIESASRAAALGGYTAIVAMPNTEPPCDSASVVADVLARGRSASCEVAVAGAITVGRGGRALAPMAEMAELGVTLFTDDGACVHDGDVMRRALEYTKGLSVTCAQHCEDPVLAAGGVMHEGRWSSMLGLRGQPTLAETSIVARDLGLVALTGASLHFLHLSAPESVRLVAAARDRGLPVTCEVAPHHLTLDDSQCVSYDPRFKVNPPLRPTALVKELIELLRAGAIDAVATDHAPHASERKDLPFDEASPGMLGLQHALGLTVEALGGTETLDLLVLFDLLSRHPAAIAQLRGADERRAGHSPHGGDVAVGEAANLCAIDLESPTVVTDASIVSRSKNSPYVGRTLPVTVRHTLLRGVPTVLDGAAVR
ncbi:MAG TPA: dihydroorotase [Acidimicrobiales bacterium]|jgi:dihydroorotase|nr:dihydroorotase [Acidimicrobiales bacterium]